MCRVFDREKVLILIIYISTMIMFRCTGDWSSVDAGRARIVFQRNLSSAMDSQCQSVSVARPYYSQWASIPVHWTHGGMYLLNECVYLLISA